MVNTHFLFFNILNSFGLIHHSDEWRETESLFSDYLTKRHSCQNLQSSLDKTFKEDREIEIICHFDAKKGAVRKPPLTFS
jgi:hypothetical protein